MSGESPELDARLHDPRVVDTPGRLVDTATWSEGELAAAVEVMDAIARWRQAEQRVSEASQRYMRLSETDMKALQYIIVAENQERLVTARQIAEHLAISSASTTKLLDRLAAGEHIQRQPHPEDRRAITVTINPATRAAAEATIGSEYARRFRVAAALPADQQQIVIAFLDALSRTEEDAWGPGPAGPQQPPRSRPAARD